MAVNPRLGVRWQQGGPQFARREHHALVGAIEPVPIDVKIMEFVVGADFLQLRVGIRQGQPVPQPDIVDCRLVGFEHLGGKLLFGGKRLCCDPIEIVRLPGECDVAFDVGLLQLQLAWFDEELPEQPGNAPDSTKVPTPTSTIGYRRATRTETPRPDDSVTVQSQLARHSDGKYHTESRRIWLQTGPTAIFHFFRSHRCVFMGTSQPRRTRISAASSAVFRSSRTGRGP